MKIYWFYNQRFIVDWEFKQDKSLNGYYDLSFFLNYPEYQLPTLTVIDWIVTNTEKKIFIAEYNENLISQENINLYLSSIPKEFNIEILTNPIEWIRSNTIYIEETPWKFILSPEKEMMWIPTRYLIIE